MLFGSGGQTSVSGIGRFNNASLGYQHEMCIRDSYYPVATGTWYTRAVQDDVMSAWWVMPFERNCTITLTNYGEQPVEISKAAAVSGRCV